ncbi:MAG TPA: hypothetical protein VG722_10995 [Tepidisphaeraceae bacterium]|nr:hypothetical protein [Tepidisphaeraceae bacterium]
MATELLPTSERGLSAVLPDGAATARFLNRPFRYIDDPICIVAMLVYLVNRCALKPEHIGGWLVHDYLNDLLCLPIFLPIILRLQSALGIRRHDLPPTLFELIHNWFIFSVLYYYVFPRLSAFTSVADLWNSVAYLVGGVAAFVCWQLLYPSQHQ